MPTKPVSPGVDIASLLGPTIPAELGELLDRNASARARFWRLEDAERTGFVRFVEESASSTLRACRAMALARGLLGASAEEPVSRRSWQI